MIPKVFSKTTKRDEYKISVQIRKVDSHKAQVYRNLAFLSVSTI